MNQENLNKKYDFWKENRINFEEKNKFPSFKSHHEAIKYFKNVCGNENFKLSNIIEYELEKGYVYHIIYDMKTYLSSIKKYDEFFESMIFGPEEPSEIEEKSKEFLIEYKRTYQAIEIYEDGSILVHD